MTIALRLGKSGDYRLCDHSAWHSLQASVYDILPSSTALVCYAVLLCFQRIDTFSLVLKMMAVSLAIQTALIISGLRACVRACVRVCVTVYYA